jgi:nucleoside-diphosphate-sugar epimerase
LNKEKIAILGFGWLGIPIGIHLKKLNYQIVGTTRSFQKQNELQELGLDTLLWDSKEENQNEICQEEFKATDYCILNFPPGKLENHSDYAFYLLKAISFFPLQTKYIFISTTGIYPSYIKQANEDSFAWDENEATNAISFAEKTLFRTLGDRLTIIRMAGLVGPNRHPAKFFAGRKAIPNGLDKVNLIHQVDSIQIILKILEKQRWGEIYNACSSEHPTRCEYYTFSCSKFGFELPEFINEGEGKIVDNSKSIKDLGMIYQMEDPKDYWNME